MQKAIVNGKSFEITQQEEELVVNGQPLKWDVARINDNYFHIIYENKSYRAELIKTEAATKTFTYKINGRIYSVELKDKFDLLLEKMGIANAGSGKLNNMKAPMPGLIIDLKIKAGDQVKAGDPLLILEAMKMENILKAPGEGTVKNVKVKKGDSVEKGEIMIEFL
ncbi:MAG: acetyl-CoA carboxylase biotin carboxyl carrier protein subunit [Bacteroidota bacterium]